MKSDFVRISFNFFCLIIFKRKLLKFQAWKSRSNKFSRFYGRWLKGSIQEGTMGEQNGKFWNLIDPKIRLSGFTSWKVISCFATLLSFSKLHPHVPLSGRKNRHLYVRANALSHGKARALEARLFIRRSSPCFPFRGKGTSSDGPKGSKRQSGKDNVSPFSFLATCQLHPSKSLRLSKES